MGVLGHLEAALLSREELMSAIDISKQLSNRIILEPTRASERQERTMCRNIKVLYNFAPPATDTEIKAAAKQYVRKISGFASPSSANEEAFSRAVKAVADASVTLLESLVTNAPPRNREVEAARAHSRAVLRFGSAKDQGRSVSPKSD